MATTEKYENLPGVKVTYEDGQLFTGSSQQTATTQSKLIIGSAVDGPTGEPVSVRELGIKEVDKLFGGMLDRTTKEPNGSSLVRGMYESILAGNDDIRLIRVDGKSAQTVLNAKDLARATEQFLDYAKGNTAFSANLSIPENGRFVGEITVSEIDKDTGVSKVIANAIRNVDASIAGQEKAYFYADKMRPGNTVKMSFDYENYVYTMVPKADEGGIPDYTDPDYTLNRDVQENHYFYSSRRNWSDKLESGHVPVVVVKDNTTGVVATISSTTPAGELIYRVGKGFNAANPLTDAVSASDYKDGGIFFTAAYDAEVAKGVYPDITGNVTVTVEYAWYSSFANKTEVTATVPGQDTPYNLNYTPMSDQFSIFYMEGQNKVVVDPAGYGLDISDKQVTIFAGAVPVGVQLYAGYKTSSNTASDPKLFVYGKYDGEVYGSLTDQYDPTTLRGVRVEIQVDPEDPAGVEKIIIFHKPTEKKLTSQDNALRYKTKALTAVRTLRQLVQYVNTDPNNNVVRLFCPNEFGSVRVQGLLETAPMYLGEESPGVIKEDPTQAIDSPDRFPWLGQNGLFDPTKPADMAKLYEKLGGTYESDGFGNIKLTSQGIYNRLENYAVDVIVLVDAYANSIIDPLAPEKNFATQLAQHCAVVTAKTYETIGVISMAPALESTLLAVQEYVDIATGVETLITDERKKTYENAGIRLDYVNMHSMFNEATHEYVLNEKGETIDVGRYVSVVFGPEVGLTSDQVGNYVAPGALVYGSLITTLNAEVATTNKQLPSVYGLRYRLSEGQHDQLIGGRYVTFDTKAFSTTGTNRAVSVKDGVTAARPNSDYGRLSTIRITHLSVQLVRRKAEPYIGLPNGLAQRNALSAEIQAGLDALKENGVLQRFNFVIFSSAADQVLGNAFITLELVPQFELRKFNASVVLKAS
ncbi:hypothetical protein PUW25_25300 (plasmid) [Paenibacillus urinalis]|uniref:Tail sheath protein n=1 Tax=Paenibacillus urinalis TaxID=521520 RepID=A0ABY7XKQ9_9BACL|nr:hypothetical protein [Paenibacillus urinalis]WDI05127.1 hypothetical protein PUW25_25300 [Paenibacillus urinalis]